MNTSTWQLSDGFDLERIGIETSSIEYEHSNWVKLRENGWVRRRFNGLDYYLKDYGFIYTINDPYKLGITYFNSMNQVNEYIRMKLSTGNRLGSQCSKDTLNTEEYAKNQKYDSHYKLSDGLEKVNETQCGRNNTFSLLPKTYVSHPSITPSLPPKIMSSDPARVPVSPFGPGVSDTELLVLASLISSQTESIRPQVTIEEVLKPFLETTATTSEPVQCHYEYEYGDSSVIKVQYFARDARPALRFEIDTDMPPAAWTQQQPQQPQDFNLHSFVSASQGTWPGGAEPAHSEGGKAAGYCLIGGSDPMHCFSLLSS